MPSAFGGGGDVLVDANLLLVLVTGLVDPTAVGRSKRTTQYTPDLWKLLITQLDHYGQIVVTPNVLTEVSNLCDFRDPRLGADVRRRLAALVALWTEIYVESTGAVQRPEFVRLGLTDSVILTMADRAMSARPVTVLTSDAGLYEALGRVGVPVVNFWHLAASTFDAT